MTSPYTVLHLVDEKKMATRAGFIHVPAHPSFVAKQVYPLSGVEMPSMSIELMTDAVKRAIGTALAVERDHLEPTFNY